MRPILVEKIKGEFRYVLSNEGVKPGDEVYCIGSGRMTEEHGYVWCGLRELKLAGATGLIINKLKNPPVVNE